MRVFIAVDIDESIRAALGDLQKTLQKQADIRKGDVKWVDTDAMHLTLKFLGEFKDSQLADVCKIVQEAAFRHKSFDLDIESLGTFGGRTPNILWVGLGEGNTELKQLQENIDNDLSLAGWPKESREFSGHLTLCRIRDPRAGLKLAAKINDYKDFKAGTSFVDSVRVYQSDLTPKGPIYTPLGTFNLLK